MHKLLRLALLCQMLIALPLPVLHAAQSTEPSQTEIAHWRFAHFGGRDLTLDIHMQDQLTPIQNVAFGSISEWQSMTAGVYQFAAYSSGETSDPHFVLRDVALEAGEWLTLAAVVVEGQIGGYLVQEDYSPLPSNESRLTVLYAIEDAPSVDVRMNGVPVIQATQLERDQGQINAPSVDLASDTYNLDMVETGSLQNIVLDATQVELLPNRNYLAAAVNTSEDPRFVMVGTEIQASDSSAAGIGNRALVRAAHLSSGTPSLDIAFDGEQIGALSQLYFPEFTGWIEVDAGSIEVSAQISSDGTSASTAASVEFPGGTFTTLLIVGSPQNDTLEIQAVREDFTPLPPNSVRVNVFNAYPGIGALDFIDADGTVYIERLGYPGFFGGNNGFNTFSVEAGTYDLQIALNETGENLIDLDATSFYAGRSYFIAAIAADPPYVLTFSDVQETQNLLQADTTP